MVLNLELTHEIQNLDLKSLEELRLFIEKLLKKQKQPSEKKDKNIPKKPLLADMERIPIPVNNIIIDRAELYENSKRDSLRTRLTINAVIFKLPY